MDEPIVIRVDGPPPSRRWSRHLADADHSPYESVVALRVQLHRAMTGREPIAGSPVGVEFRLWRASCESDPLSIIAGVLDVIQRQTDTSAYQYGVWAIDDSAEIRELHYTEQPADRDEYEVIVRRLELEDLP